MTQDIEEIGIFEKGGYVVCVNDIFRGNSVEEDRKYKIYSISENDDGYSVGLIKLNKRTGEEMKATSQGNLVSVKINEDSFDMDGFYEKRDGEEVRIFAKTDDPVAGTKSHTTYKKEKIKVGLPGQKYSAKKREGSSYGYTMRIDSALKLILNNDGWQHTQTMKFDGMTDATRTLEEDYTPLTEEGKEFYRDRIGTNSYHARVRPDENKIELTNYASTTYAFKHPDLVFEEP